MTTNSNGFALMTADTPMLPTILAKFSVSARF